MENTIKKFLLINFNDNQFIALNDVLSEYELLSSPYSDDISETIHSEKPDAIMLNSDSHDCGMDCVNEISSISSEMSIPVFYIKTSFKKTDFIELIKQGAYNVISTPISKKDFLLRLERYNTFSQNIDKIDTNDHILKLIDGETVSHQNIKSDDANLLINALLCNLETQVKFSKVNLKQKKTLKKERDGKNLFSPEEKKIEKMLYECLECDHFRLFYQPVISLETDKLFGFEALIRIDHPERGIVNPGEFIEVAEKSDIIYPLGLWIVETACKQIAQWKEKFILDTPLRINTNLSSNQFLHENLAADLLEITEKYETNHEDIGFELTESTFMEDKERANMALLQLKSKNFNLYMDDFGTGYSSLSYLMHFPMDIIKIDQSFVKWMHIDDQSKAIVKSIISMSKSLNLKVVAEGTDDEEHIEMLKQFGCDYAQGYFYAKPLPPEEAEEYILKHFVFRDAG